MKENMCDETIEVLDDNGDGLFFPAVRILCTRCNGDGTVCHPAFTEHAISAEEWETEWDDLEKEMYLGGGYDIECPECHGRRWVLTLDREQCTAEDLELADRYERAKMELEAQERAERRFGC